MEDEIELIKNQYKQLFCQLLTKTSLKNVEKNNNNFTGDNTFTSIPNVIINNIKRPLLIANTENIKENFTITIVNKKLLIYPLMFNYIIKIVQYNIILDFTNYQLLNNTSYEFNFTITGLFFVDSIINLNGNDYSIININNGNGNNLIKQKVNIDVDNNGNMIIYSNSYSYTTGIIQPNNITINSNSDSLINVESSNNNINLFNFINYSSSNNNNLSQALCNGSGKMIDQTSNSLLIKCKVESTIAGININDNYYIQMYKVEEII